MSAAPNDVSVREAAGDRQRTSAMSTDVNNGGAAPETSTSAVSTDVNNQKAIPERRMSVMSTDVTLGDVGEEVDMSLTCPNSARNFSREKFSRQRQYVDASQTCKMPCK